MHYYKRNLGDYSKKAGRLSMLQHGAYTLLLDTCYDREEFPTLEEAIDWTWASSKEEIEAVEFVLRKFFVLENGVYVQKRIQEELEQYQAKAATNARIAAEREAKRSENSTKRARIVDDASPSEHEAPPNHKPLTNNHKPLTNNQEPIPLSPKRKTKTRIDQDLKLSEHWAALASDYWKNKCRLDLDAEDQFNRFKNHHLANGTTSNDWQASWTTWYCNAVDFTRPPLQVVHASQQAAPRPIKTMRPAGSEQ